MSLQQGSTRKPEEFVGLNKGYKRKWHHGYYYYTLYGRSRTAMRQNCHIGRG